MNAKQAMRKAKKLAEQEAATRAKAEQEKDYALYYLILELDKLEWIDDARAGECLVARWPFVKEELKKQMTDGQKLDLDTVKIRMPEDASEDEEEMQMDFSNLMNEADMFFLNAKRYEEMILFFHDLLEMFDLEGNRHKLTRDNFSSAIGEAYHELGRKEDFDRYFTELLAGQERNDYVAAKYATTLLEDKDLDRAEKLLSDYRDSTDDLMQERLEWLKELKQKM